MSKSTVNVLLVEDDELDAEAIQRAFDQQQVESPITVAEDGQMALEILRGTDGAPPFPRPSIILLDLNMPRMGGIEFLKNLRSDRLLKDNIVFVLTTSDAETDRIAAYQHCVAGYIVKSRVGEGFRWLTDMLESFFRLIELPERWTE